jgi:hypothetical protein
MASLKGTRTRRPARADDLAEVQVETLDGHEIALGDMWRDGPAVLVFLRHYG